MRGVLARSFASVGSDWVIMVMVARDKDAGGGGGGSDVEALSKRVVPLGSTLPLWFYHHVPKSKPVVTKPV